MVRRYCSPVLALAACLAAELTDEPLGTVAGVPQAKDCGTAEAPCVQLWGSMSAEERARLWPFLDESSKLSYWRGMTPEERKSLRMCLSERDREALRRAIRSSIRCRMAAGSSGVRRTAAPSTTAPSSRNRLCR